MRVILPVALGLTLGACVAVPSAEPPPSPAPPPRQQPQVPPSDPLPPPAPGFRQPEIMQGPGLEGVIREDADRITRQFGSPRLDVREGDMRKLQFVSTACVLDVYLYPLAPGGEPVATWLQARRASDGVEVDRLACMQALRERRR